MIPAKLRSLYELIPSLFHIAKRSSTDFEIDLSLTLNARIRKYRTEKWMGRTMYRDRRHVGRRR